MGNENLYLLVRDILRKDTSTRNSDQKLIFEVWYRQGFRDSRSGMNEGILFTDINQFLESAHPKSIIECRRKLQREQEEKIREGVNILDSDLVVADLGVLALREQRNQERGTHVYREQAKMF